MITLSDPTALKMLMNARVETLRGGRPLFGGRRIPRKN